MAVRGGARCRRPPLRRISLLARRYQYLDEDATNIPSIASPAQRLSTPDNLPKAHAPACSATIVRSSKHSFWSLPAAPSAIPDLQVLLQWLIRLGRKKQVRNLPASARHTTVKLFLRLRGRSKVRAAHAGCCLKTLCVGCCAAARFDLTSAPTG